MKRKQILHLLKASKNGFLLGTLASLCFYAVIRVMFLEFTLTFSEEVTNVFKIVFIGGLMISAGIVSFLCLEIFIRFLGKLKFQFAQASVIRIVAVIVLLLGVVFAKAQPKPNEGLKKNAKNGFTTKYNIMVPVKSFLLMNGEELNHSDIPMGESFFVVNDKVTGLVEKDGRVSVGCSLVITDKNGKKLVNNPDLFKGKDVFTLKEASKLLCTVATGNLTGWEEKYDVVVTFRDKYGKGTIVNKVKIRMIDLP